MLTQFEGVAEAAAVALPNAYGINKICAVVVAREELDEQALRSHCAARIAHPFTPVKYFRVDSLPRNEMGKLDRRRLQEIIQELAARPVSSRFTKMPAPWRPVFETDRASDGGRGQ